MSIVSRRTLWGAALWGAASTACSSPASDCAGGGIIRLATPDTAIALADSILAAVLRIPCGNSAPPENAVTWRSRNPAVAQVDPTTGWVTGKSVGQTVVVATEAPRSDEVGGFEVFVYNPDDPTDAEARAELRYYIEDVTRANSRKYGVHDDVGHTMDGLKIIAGATAGEFIGVYQTYGGGAFDAHLATSTDLLKWRWRVRLASKAAEPTIKAAGDGYVVAMETDGDNHLRFAYYDSWSQLLRASPSKTYDAPRTLSPCAEGTPNIYSADAARVEVGFHYWSECNVGRQARGITDWSSWTVSRDTVLDNAVTKYGIAGVGDRDGMLTFRGYHFGVIEGEGVRNDYSSWRVFLYDYQTGTAELLGLRTDAGSISFGNPTIEEVLIGGRPVLVMTLFLFQEGAHGGELGSLVYYREIHDPDPASRGLTRRSSPAAQNHSHSQRRERPVP